MRSALAVLLLALAAPVLAQSTEALPPAGAERAALLERYHQLPTVEQLRLRRLWEKELKGKPPEELAKLRRELKGKRPAPTTESATPPP